MASKSEARTDQQEVEESNAESAETQPVPEAGLESENKPQTTSEDKVVKAASNSDRLVIGQEKPEEETLGADGGVEDVDVSKEPPLEDDARMRMFEEGLRMDKEGQKTEALRCYLKCLVGLKENSRFALLPQCLRNIGDIYYNKDEYDKAISFIQAEKLYYESVLIDDTQLQKHIDEVMSKCNDQEDPDLNMDALRAAEYEQLAKLCMDEKQPQLALEYAGKACKLRQQVYGEGHPLVQQSLDYFATVYAEVGKVQYTESMSKFDAAGEPDMTGGATLNSPTEPTSILRKRRGEASDREKRVRFDESQVPSQEAMDREEKFARTVLLFLFFSLCFIMVLLAIYIYCNLQRSSNCVYYRQYLNDCVMRIRYWYYHFSSTKDVKYA